MNESRRVFLRADWRYLAMLNYRIDSRLLASFVPYGTEIDTFHGETYVSIVAFLFLNTRVLGVSVPFHRNFEEINLRFYVTRNEGGQIRRAAVFIQELVPRRAITWVARTIYNENYSTARMAHRLQHRGDTVDLRFDWSFAGSSNLLSVTGAGPLFVPEDGSLEQFIAEHYWGYVAQRNGDTVEYQVNHPAWRIWKASDWSLDANLAVLYGERFAQALAHGPDSVFLAEGSAVSLSQGRRIRRVRARFKE